MGKMIVTVGRDGNSTIAAYCLKTDSWQDFLAFKADAIQAEKKGDFRKMNRCLRAGLIFLFSHLEGFVNDVEKYKKIPVIYMKGTLCDRTLNIYHEVKKYKKLPYLNFRLGKCLRDLIAHPGIEKFYKDGKRLDTVSVFEELNLTTLEELESQISIWIDAVSTVLNVDRFTDTKRLVTQLGEKLGKVEDTREI